MSAKLYSGSLRILAEYSFANIALHGDLHAPSTHTSLESPYNGGINSHIRAWPTTRGIIYYNVKMGVLGVGIWEMNVL